MTDPKRIPVEPEILDAESKAQTILRKALKLAAHIPFARDVIAMVYALQDPNVPMSKKATIGAALLYFISPLDLIPDFLPGGYLDDAAVIAAAFKSVQDIISDEHLARADALLEKTKNA